MAIWKYRLWNFADCTFVVKSPVYWGRILGRNWERVFLLAIHSHLYTNVFYPCPGAKVVCHVNIVYGNFKSANSQVYAKNPNWNCASMNSASVLWAIGRQTELNASHAVSSVCHSSIVHQNRGNVKKYSRDKTFLLLFYSLMYILLSETHTCTLLMT